MNTPSFFGGDTGLTYEDLKRRRDMAALMHQRGSNSRAPRTLMEGLNSAAQSVTGALLANKLGKELKGKEDAFTESLSGSGIDPARLALMKNMSLPQQQAYALSFMDKQDALKRSAAGSGSNKSALQALMVSKLMGESGGDDQPQAQPVSGFDIGQQSTPNLSLPELDQPSTSPILGPISTPPAVSAPMSLDAPNPQPTFSSQGGAQPQAGIATPPSNVGPSPQQPVTSMDFQPTQGLSFDLPAPAAPAPAEPVDMRGQLTSDINNLYGMFATATTPEEQKAIQTAIKMKTGQLGLIPEVEKGTSSQQDYQFYLDDEKSRGNANPMSFQEWSVSDELAGNPSAPDVNKTRTDYQRYPVTNANGEVTGYRESVTPGSETHRAMVRDRDMAVAKGAQSLELLDSIITDPSLPSITGMIQGNLPPMTQAGTDLDVKIKQLKGKAFLEAFETLKGGGQITELEGRAATDAMARLDRAQSEEAYVAALNELKQVVAAGVERARRGVTVDALGVESQFGTRPSVGGVGGAPDFSTMTDEQLDAYLAENG